MFSLLFIVVWLQCVAMVTVIAGLMSITSLEYTTIPPTFTHLPVLSKHFKPLDLYFCITYPIVSPPLSNSYNIWVKHLNLGSQIVHLIYDTLRIYVDTLEALSLLFDRYLHCSWLHRLLPYHNNSVVFLFTVFFILTFLLFFLRWQMEILQNLRCMSSAISTCGCHRALPSLISHLTEDRRLSRHGRWISCLDSNSHLSLDATLRVACR